MQGPGVVPAPLSLRSSVQIPSVPSAYLSRPRLLVPLLRSRQRLLLLCAPAGYGKTLLLAEALCNSPAGGQCLWLSLGGQPLGLDELCARIMGELGLGVPHSHPASALLRFLAFSEQPLDLVLDDLPGDMGIELNAWFERLLALPGGKLRLLVSSRQRPAWNLPRLALKDELLELDASQLALNRAEGEQLAALWGHAPDSTALDDALRRSGGGCAVLRLLLDGASRPGGRSLLRDYLEHEVLGRLGADERQALYSLAHLPKFSAELCEQLWDGQGGVALFRRLLQQQAFIFPLPGDEHWHALPAAVAEALQGRLGTAELGRLRLHSCRLLSIAGHLNDAIEQALSAQQPEVAASYMERLQPGWQLSERYLQQLLRWRGQLPEHLLESTPRLVYLSSLALLFGGRLTEAAETLVQLERFLPHPDAGEQQRLLGNWQALAGVIAGHRGDLEQARVHCREAIPVLAASDWRSLLLCHSTLARAAMAEGRLEEAGEQLRLGVELARRAGCLDSEVLINTDRLRLLILKGELGLAEALLQDSLDARAAGQLQPDPLMGRLFILKGELHLLHGALELAEQALHQGLGQVRESTAPFVLNAYLALAELATRRGCTDEAQMQLDRAERRMHCAHIDPHCYERPIALQRLRLLSERGQWQLLLEAGEHQSLGPLLGFPELPVQLQLLLARAEQAVGRLGCAQRRVAELLEHCRLSGLQRLAEVANAWLVQWGHPDEQPDANPAGELEGLTSRETAVLRLLAQGLSNQEIGNRLFISVNTVKYHAKNINIKLGAKRRTQAIVFAKSMGLLA